MSNSKSEKGLGSTDPNRAFLSAHFLPLGGAAGAPTAAGGWLGCSTEISQLSFGRTIEQGSGASDQWPLRSPAQEEVTEWGSSRSGSSLSRDVKSLRKHPSGWAAVLSHHLSQLAHWMLTWPGGFIAFTRFSKEPVIHRGQESLVSSKT